MLPDDAVGQAFASRELTMIRALWLLPAVIACACDRAVPHVDDPSNIVINGEKMSATAFIEKYCIGKERDFTCSKVLEAATRNFLDKARVPDL
jgi:hypothetical protein